MIKDAYTKLKIEIPNDFIEQMTVRNGLSIASTLGTTTALNLNCDRVCINCELKSVKFTCN